MHDIITTTLDIHTAKKTTHKIKYYPFSKQSVVCTIPYSYSYSYFMIYKRTRFSWCKLSYTSFSCRVSFCAVHYDVNKKNLYKRVKFPSLISYIETKLKLFTLGYV